MPVKKFITIYLIINLIFLMPFLLIYIIETVFGIPTGGFITGTYAGAILMYHLFRLTYLNIAVSGASAIYFIVNSITKKQLTGHITPLVVSACDVILNIFTACLGKTMMVQ